MKSSGEHLIVVQASTVSWRGDADPCFHNLEGKPVIDETLKRIRKHCPATKIVIVAPEYDKNSPLARYGDDFENLDTHFGFDASPLDRLIGVCDRYNCEYITRIDGMHFCADMAVADQMLKLARSRKLDCVKLPDDFPVHYTSDIYSQKGLRRAKEFINLSGEKKYEIHPKFLMFREPDFSTAEHDQLPEYSLESMRENRAVFQKIRFPRHEVTNKSIKLGDLASFHYEIACGHLSEGMSVLDAACGTGYGSCMMAALTGNVVGADLAGDVIKAIGSETILPGNVKFVTENVEKLSFETDSFDAVVSMETIDYVDEAFYLSEIKRVLKPGGVFILSTQQNRAGYLSVNSVSETGYTLQSISRAVGEKFDITRIYSFKAGRIYYEDDFAGRNLILVAKNR